MRSLTAVLVALLTALVAIPATAASNFPEVIALPDGFRPEGIASAGTTFYTGSLGGVGIYRGDLRTGEGAVFIPGNGRTFTGMVGAGSEGEWSVLLEDGRTISVAKDQVDEMHPVKRSAMPEGLLNELEEQEIADLFEFLTSEQSESIASPAAAPTVR